MELYWLQSRLHARPRLLGTPGERQHPSPIIALWNFAPMNEQLMCQLASSPSSSSWLPGGDFKPASAGPSHTTFQGFGPGLPAEASNLVFFFAFQISLAWVCLIPFSNSYRELACSNLSQSTSSSPAGPNGLRIRKAPNYRIPKRPPGRHPTSCQKVWGTEQERHGWWSSSEMSFW